MINHIGTKVKQLRLLKRISQQELCSDVLNRTILSHIENNKMYPSIPQLEYIANTLGVHINDFFDCNDVMFNESIIEHSKNVFEILYKQKKYNEVLKLIYNEDSIELKKNMLNFYFVGMSFFYINSFNNSLTYLRRFVYYYTNSSSEVQKFLCIQFTSALNTLFKIMLTNKNYEKGIKYLSVAKKYLYLYNIIDSEISYIIHSNLAYAYTRKAKFENVITLLERFLNYNKKLVYTNIMPDMHLILNIAYYNVGNYAASLEHIDKCRFFYNYIGKHDLAVLTNLNVINIYRYSNQFDKAFLLVDKCKKESKGDTCIYHRFLMQECILLFNSSNFGKVKYVLDNINFNQLTTSNRKDYLFLKGHIAFNSKDYNKAKNYFKKCINYYIYNNNNYDLSLIYSDLYYIENDCKYLDLITNLKSKYTEKNILGHWYV